MGSTRDKLWVTHSSDDDEDGGDDAVALIEMLRGHFGVSIEKMSRSDLYQQKENAFRDMKTQHIKELTHELTVDSDGGEEKCSVYAVEQSKQPYTAMTLQKASKTFSNLNKGISLDEVIDDYDVDEEEFDLPGGSNHNVDDAEPSNNYNAAELPVNGFDVAGLPEDFKLSDSQKECVADMRNEMEKGQMLVFVHGPAGSGKTTTARLLVSEKNLNLVFSGTTGTASAMYKAETINSLLCLGRSVEDFDASKKRLSAQY